MKRSLLNTVIISSLAATAANAAKIDYSALSQADRDHYQEITLGAQDDRINNLEDTVIIEHNNMVAAHNGILNQIDKTNQNVQQLQQQQGNFVDKPTYNTDKSTQAQLDAGQDSKIAGKVDTTTYNADQQAQDSKINANTAAITGKVDQTAYDTDKAANAAYQSQQDTAIAGKVDQTAYDTDKAAQKVIDDNQDKTAALKLDKATYASGLVKQDGIDKAQDALIDANTNTGTQNKQFIDVNTRSINQLNTDTNKLKQDVAGHDTRITTLETDIGTKADQTQVDAIDTKVSGLDKQQQVNTDNIKQNNKMIIDNANGISGLRTDVDKNTQDIAGKADKADLAKKVDVTTYVAGQAQQQTQIDANKQGVDDNKQDISKNAADVKQNRQYIDVNSRAINNLNTNVDANKQGIATNSAAIATKVDTTTFTADQQRQDQVIAGKADAVQVQANARQLANDEKTEQQHFSTLQAGVKQAQDIGAYAQKRADDAFANAAANRAALADTNKRVADHTAELANHEQRISELEKNTNANFSDLKHEVESNRRRASAAISGVAAMANIPQVIESQTFNVGAGVGTTDGETAVAVGFSARASEHVVVKASVSNDSQHNFVVGGGVSYGW